MVTKYGDFHHPNNLSDKNDFTENYKKAISYVNDGLTVKDACVVVFGITDRTFRNWYNWAIDDIENGFNESESNLIKLMLGLAKADAELHRKLSKKAQEIALNDGNVSMIQFLLKTRYGYSEKSKAELEVTNDNAPITFNIVPMTPNKEDDNENNY